MKNGRFESADEARRVAAMAVGARVVLAISIVVAIGFATYWTWTAGPVGRAIVTVVGVVGLCVLYVAAKATYDEAVSAGAVHTDRSSRPGRRPISTSDPLDGVKNN